MVQATPFLLLLSLALVAPGLCARKCVLTGRWVNDLGSNMTIGVMNENDEFTGFYHTAVSSTTNKIQKSPLQGSQNNINSKSQPTFGFTVKWTFSGASPFPDSLQCPPSSPALPWDALVPSPVMS
ncbi:PREDICTED: avidin-like [Calidris pugnax]|uniref:avidin-like n=1 Tax=Calidris pugnax TaxID=198806 RepID=UPI00071E364D|nr:PREDICTED: avidin-like [Calidris pugnax]